MELIYSNPLTNVLCSLTKSFNNFFLKLKIILNQQKQTEN